MAPDPSRTSEIRLRAAVESAPSGLLMVDVEGRIVLVNREIERLFGYPREELLGRSVDFLVPEAFREGHGEFRAEYFAEPRGRAMGAGRDLYGRRKDGSQVPVEIGLTPVETEEGLFVLSSIVDITARRGAEARFRAAVESSPAGMVMVDAQGRIVLVNREVERMFGWQREELMGRSIELLVPARFGREHPRYRDGFFHSPSTRPMGVGRDLYGLRKDGSEVPVEIGLNPIETDDGVFVLSSIVDISERKREEAVRAQLEQELRQAQKMDAVGTLAGGIAHDFNNILGAILGFGELLRDSVHTDQGLQDLEELIAFTLRGRSLVEKIQAFGRRHEGQRQALDLAGVVREVESFLRSSLPPSVQITSRIHPESPRVMADPSAVHQVLMNLGMNAGQAMPGGGRLDIEVEKVYVTDSRARAHPELQEGYHALVKVQDTGTGIPSDLLERVFEPFFTTKPVGQGTGLGLAIVHRIVRDHGGVIELESAPGQGSTFRLMLPAADVLGAEESIEAEAPLGGGGELVLYVDDEPGLGTVGKRRLEALGYRVVLASDGEEALDWFRADPGAFDAVVSDYLMPRRNGLELAALLSRIRPGLPIILLTGYIDDLPDDVIRAAGVREVLRKPATIGQLGMALRKVLEARDA